MTAPKQRSRLQQVRDGRSAWARRHRQLAADFAADLGSSLSKIDLALISHAATVALEAEQLKAAQLNDHLGTSTEVPACDRFLWLNGPSLSPDRKVCLFLEHRSTAPTAYASQPRQSVWV
jgi:hypothetical protein